ncbi:MAG: FecR domain-containing protein [Acidobacteria bacterium]|nr:FecR domain-containing protein [Acidobacteriota bacterium]
MFTTFRNLSRLALLLTLGPGVFLGAPAPVQAQQPYAPEDEAYQGEAPERYAQVKLVEGEVRVRKGDLDETLNRGVPIGEGDLIDSRGRGVLQLGDGTRLAFAPGTRFQVAALFTDKKGERQVLLRLDQGRLRIAMGGQSEARVRVDTPAGTAAMLDRGDATVVVEGDQGARVRVHSGHLTFTNDRDQARVNAGERLTVYSRADSLDRVRAYNTYERDGFDQFCERALQVRRGKSWDHVPAEIRYYSDDLDDNGEWTEVPEVGWCWRPRISIVDWRPYWRGRWGCYGGGMTWVSDDPWGYVTFHFGRWGWNSGWGWYWIPGRYYSPAWVAWNWNAGYYGWAPLNYWNRPCSWGYGAWGGHHCWNVVQVNHINVVNVHQYVRADRTVIAGFSGGTGATGWNGYRTGPLIATTAEFRNPGQLARAFDRQVAEQRLTAYERAAQAATGRSIVRRDPAELRRGADRAQGIPFEDRGRIRPQDRPVLRDAGRPTDQPPVDRGRASDVNRGRDLPGTLERRPESGTRERGRDERGRDFFGEERRNPERPIERAPDRAPRSPEERGGAPRDRQVPREDVRRESPRIERPAPAERPRREMDTPRAPEPQRDRPRESFREERRSEPPPRSESPRGESRPSAPPPSHSQPSAPPRSAPPAPSRGNDGPRGR